MGMAMALEESFYFMCKQKKKAWQFLELRQYKNNLMDWRKLFVLKFPRFFASLFSEKINAANSKKKINPSSRSYISLALETAETQKSDLENVTTYSSVPNKRTCTPYLISTKLPPCTLLFWPVRLFIFGIWNLFSKNLVYYLVTYVYFWLIGDKPAWRIS